ncbi:MAG: TolB family protein, partial [Acidimicrobiia bacterium]
MSTAGAERNKLPTGSTTGCSSLTVGKCSKRTVSADGNAVVFASRAPNLIDGDNNNASDIFVWKRDTSVAPPAITLTRISVATGGGDSNGDSETPAMSPNGQWVAFESKATNLVAGDTNSSADVFVWSAATGLALASQNDSGAQGNLQSFAPSVADNGTVAFTSIANNLVGPGKTSQFQNVFVRKTPTGAATTDIVSVGPSDVPGGGPSKEPSIDAAGNMVAFTSAANNIGDGTEDDNGEDDVFVRDLTARTTKRLTADLKAFQPAIRGDGNQVAYAAELGDSDIRKDIFVQSSSGNVNGGSLASGCTPCNDITDRPAVVPSIADDGKVAFQSAARYEPAVRSDQVWVTTGPIAASKDKDELSLADNVAELASISGNGQFVAFTSAATNLVPGDFNGSEDVFLKDLSTKAVTRVSQRADGVEASGFAPFPTHAPAISGDGSVVAFSSDSSNLVDGDSNGVNDIFVRAGGATTRISVGPGGAQANGGSIRPAISADGRYVAFNSLATNLVSGDTNGNYDIFVRDTVSGSTTRVNVSASGVQASGGNSLSPSISGDGRWVAFSAGATNLVSGQDNGTQDVYLKDLQTGGVTRVSNNTGGGQANGDSADASISWDGRFVAYWSSAGDIVAGDNNSCPTTTYTPTCPDIFVWDRQTGANRRVSVSTAGVQGDRESLSPALSVDGRFVAFDSKASN